MKMAYYNTFYQNAIKQFLEGVKGVDMKGLPEPHLPCIGKEYSNVKYKFAFYGIETNGWGDLQEFVSLAKKNPLKALVRGYSDINRLEYYYTFRNNFGTSFFDFVIKLMMLFYKVKSMDDMVSSAEHKKILQSIIWGNTNSIEGYDVTSKEMGVEYKDWCKVKEASKVFDTPKSLFSELKPNVVVIMNWSEDEEWLMKVGSINGPEKIDDHLYYYHNFSTDSHILWTAHPRWMHINGKFDAYLKMIMKIIIKKNIFEVMPESYEDAFL